VQHTVNKVIPGNKVYTENWWQ